MPVLCGRRARWPIGYSTTITSVIFFRPGKVPTVSAFWHRSRLLPPGGGGVSLLKLACLERTRSVRALVDAHVFSPTSSLRSPRRLRPAKEDPALPPCTGCRGRGSAGFG